MEQRLHDAASRLPEVTLEFEQLHQSRTEAALAIRRKIRRAVVAAAVCLVLLASAGLGSYAYAVEVREYNDAVQFFNDHDLSMEGLTRGEIKAVYRDITTSTFSYSKTAEVIQSGLSAEQVGGYEISQEPPSPEDLEALWNFRNQAGNGWFLQQQDPQGINYKYHASYTEDDLRGLVHECSYLEQYDGDTLVWSVPFTEFRITGHSSISDGVIVYGSTETWSSTQSTCAWVAKIDASGSLCWKQPLANGFKHEYVAAVLENADGSYAVISRGDYNYFCLGQYSADGQRICFQKTEIGNYGIWNVAHFDGGYLVQLGSYLANEHAQIVKVDHSGSITESFLYSGEDACYYITDMIGYGGKIYLSAYAVPKSGDEEQSAGGRYEIAAILNYLLDNNIWDISSEDLTPMVRDNYTAMLLVCDPKEGTPREFYSVKGSLGGTLALSGSGDLLWNVESIATTFFSPATSSFTIGGTSYVYRYTFDHAGKLISQERTGELVNYRR